MFLPTSCLNSAGLHLIFMKHEPLFFDDLDFAIRASILAEIAAIKAIDLSCSSFILTENGLLTEG